MIYCIEGIDGSGKATQSKLLAERLDAELFSFPNYETTAGKLILGNLKNEWHAPGVLLNALVLQSLMLTNRMEMGVELRAASEEHNVVLDRYDTSAMVYGSLDGLDPNWLRHTNAQLPVRPDAYIFIDIPVAESWRRRPERRDRYEKDPAYLERVRAAYIEYFFGPHDDGADYYTVDGVGTVEEVQDRIAKALQLEIEPELVPTAMSANERLAFMEAEFSEWKKERKSDTQISPQAYANELDGWIRALGDARFAAQKESRKTR